MIELKAMTSFRGVFVCLETQLYHEIGGHCLFVLKKDVTLGNKGFK